MFRSRAQNQMSQSRSQKFLVSLGLGLVSVSTFTVTDMPTLVDNGLLTANKLPPTGLYIMSLYTACIS